MTLTAIKSLTAIDFKQRTDRLMKKVKKGENGTIQGKKRSKSRRHTSYLFIRDHRSKKFRVVKPGSKIRI